LYPGRGRQMILHGDVPSIEKQQLPSRTRYLAGAWGYANACGRRRKKRRTFMSQSFVSQSIVPADGIMLPIWGAETSVRRRFLRSSQSGSLPVCT
jgi:hypothetical protein